MHLHVHRGICIIMRVILDFAHSWLLAFLTQLNPLMGPYIPTDVAAHIRRAWENQGDKENQLYKCKFF